MDGVEDMVFISDDVVEDDGDVDDDDDDDEDDDDGDDDDAKEYVFVDIFFMSLLAGTVLDGNFRFELQAEVFDVSHFGDSFIDALSFESSNSVIVASSSDP